MTTSALFDVLLTRAVFANGVFLVVCNQGGHVFNAVTTPLFIK